MIDKAYIEQIFQNAGNALNDNLNSSIDEIMDIINQLQNDNFSLIKFFLYTFYRIGTPKEDLRHIVENYPYKNTLYSEKYDELLQFIESI